MRRFAAELAKLQVASNQLQQDNARLILQERENSWLWKSLVVLVVYLVGLLCGVFYQQGQRADLPADIDIQIQRSLLPAIPRPPTPAARTPG